MNFKNIGKILAAMGAALTAVGIGLPLSSNYRELIIAGGVFVTAVSAFLAHTNGQNPQ